MDHGGRFFLKALGDRIGDNKIRGTREMPIRWKKNLIIMKTVRHWHKCQRGCGISISGDTHNSPTQGPEQLHLTGPTSSRELDQITSEDPSKSNLKNEAHYSDQDVTKFTTACDKLKKQAIAKVPHLYQTKAAALLHTCYLI